MLLTALGCVVALFGSLVWWLRARSPDGVRRHSGWEFFFGITRHEGRAVLKDKTECISEYNLNEMKRNGFQAYGWGHVGGGRRGIVICDPADIKFVLKDNFDNFEKSGELISIFHQLLGDGIFNTNGELWKEQRNIASHMFSRRQLRERMSTVFGAHSLELLAEIRSHSGSAINIQPYFYNFTFDTINRIAFNREVNALRGNERDRAFQQAFDVLQSKLIGRFLTPWWRINRYFQLSEDERTIAASVNTITDYVANVVDGYYDDDGLPKEDTFKGDQTLAGLFLESAVAEGRVTTKGYLKDMILNFVIAGRDTTASGLTSCIKLLCGEDEWQRKLHEEAVRCFGKEADHPLTFDDIVDCPVSKAVFLEALRLHPPVPLNEKVTLRHTTLPSGIRLKPHDHVGWLPVATNRMPAHYGPDAERFSPSRWLTGKHPDDYHYPTFNAGPRLCLGRDMAILEGQIALLTLFSKLRFSKVDGATPKLVNSVTWQLDSNGLQVNVEDW